MILTLTISDDDDAEVALQAIVRGLREAAEYHRVAPDSDFLRHAELATRLEALADTVDNTKDTRP